MAEHIKSWIISLINITATMETTIDTYIMHSNLHKLNIPHNYCKPNAPFLIVWSNNNKKIKYIFTSSNKVTIVGMKNSNEVNIAIADFNRFMDMMVN